ncbi:MAG: hypothetical protein AAF267_23075, partial [Deinococcota bacterium]
MAPDFGLEPNTLTNLATQADLQPADIAQLVAEASDDFRSLVALYTGMMVQAGSLTTLGLEASLSPDTAALVANMSGGQYGLTARVDAVPSSRPRLELQVRVVAVTDAPDPSSSLLRETFPLLERPLLQQSQEVSERPVYAEAVRDLAREAAQFIRQQAQLDPALA